MLSFLLLAPTIASALFKMALSSFLSSENLEPKSQVVFLEVLQNQKHL